MLSLFKPAPHIQRLSADRIDPVYRRLRWQIFIGIFFGYAAYYLVRKNFALAFPSLMEQGFSKGELGTALSAISIAYGLSKFIMGSFSDQANPRYFLPTRAYPCLGCHAYHGLLRLGNLFRLDYGYSAVSLRMVPGDGLAAVRTHHGALVVTEGARRNCINLELCP